MKKILSCKNPPNEKIFTEKRWMGSMVIVSLIAYHWCKNAEYNRNKQMFCVKFGTY